MIRGVLGSLNGIGRVLGAAAKRIFFAFDPAQVTFTAGMAKRKPPAGPFAAAPVVQGKWADGSASDTIVLTLPSAISGLLFSIIDLYQGTISFWITPEWNGNDGLYHNVLTNSGSGTFTVFKSSSGGGRLYVNIGNGGIYADCATWVAGTTYHVVLRWDSKNTLDGTNYMCLSVNDVHSFGQSTAPTIASPGNIYIGSSGTAGNAVNALLQGLCISRVPWFDGTYGVDLGCGDIINLVYAAGAGKDPAELLGSWDTALMVPTDATPGAMTTGNGNAWCHPHTSEQLQQWYAGDGYYGGGGFALSMNFSIVDCGNNAGLVDLGASGNIFQIEGWYRSTSTSSQVVASKSNSATGWWCVISSGGITYFRVYLTGGAIQSNGVDTRDGKWHHFLGHYNDATKIAKLALDGVWSADSAVGSGAYVSDVGQNLLLGRETGGIYNFFGSVGWWKVHNHAHYTPGTNFVPPRLPPAVDANTVAQYNMAEGTGLTVDNAEGTAARDGTITAGTWVRQWEDVGTPVECRSVGLAGTGGINCGSEASVDNLHDGEFTAECWIRQSLKDKIIMAKGPTAWTTGWVLAPGTGGMLYGVVYCATTAAMSVSTAMIVDNRWHHVAMYFNDAGDRKVYLEVDGVWQTYSTQTAGVGAIVSDAADDLTLGYKGLVATPTNPMTGALGWTRISNNDRLVHGTNFIPPARTVVPANDANTIRLYPMNEGAGTVITDLSTNAQNGTLSNGTWLNSRSMVSDEPGARIYNWGYSIGTGASYVYSLLDADY